MKVLIVSDTHRNNENFFKVVEMHHPDLVVHCGDVEGTEYAISEGAGCPVYVVRGNNDFFSSLPAEIEFEVEGRKCWVLHGHHYGVSFGPDALRREAKAKGVDVVMYGHTHRPEVIKEGGLVSVNPGSISYPRQEGRKCSYCIMEFDRYGVPHYTIAYLE